MGIKIRFEKSPLVVQTTLKDEALSQLLALIQEHGEEAAPNASPDGGTLINFSGSSELSKSSDPEKDSKIWLAQHSAAEVLNKLAWNTYAEKILALGAYHESKAGEDFDSWRSADILSRFSEAKDAAPTNFPRDIAAAIKSGLVATKTPRTYIVSRTGWIQISSAISKLAG